MLKPRQALHVILNSYRMITKASYPHELDTIRSYIDPGGACVDVGAHGGVWTYPLSKLAKEVYSFEALPYYAQVLRSALRALNARNVSVVNVAVSDQIGAVPIVFQDQEGNSLTGLTHIAGIDERPQAQIMVQATTLDAFFRRHDHRRITFLKCDVEGCEWRVMKGARDMIATYKPVIFAEANSYSGRYGKTPSDLMALLGGYGYSSNLIGNDGILKTTSPESYSGDGDILFLPA